MIKIVIALGISLCASMYGLYLQVQKSGNLKAQINQERATIEAQRVSFKFTDGVISSQKKIVENAQNQNDQHYANSSAAANSAAPFAGAPTRSRGRSGRYFWYGEHDNPLYARGVEPRAFLRGGVFACSSSDMGAWRNEGVVLHFANTSNSFNVGDAPLQESPFVTDAYASVAGSSSSAASGGLALDYPG